MPRNLCIACQDNPTPSVVKFIIPTRIRSMQNESTHWRAVQSARKKHRKAAWICAMAAAVPNRTAVVVTLCRVAPRPLDGHDNLRHGFKGIVDGIADAMGLASDADPIVEWRYIQRRGAVREYLVEVEVTLR